MTQKEFINAFADKSGRTKVESKEILDEFLDIITDSLIEGDGLNLYGFGKFSKHLLSARKKYNPITKEYITTNPRWAVRFKPGDSLVNALNA